MEPGIQTHIGCKDKEGLYQQRLLLNQVVEFIVVGSGCYWLFSLLDAVQHEINHVFPSHLQRLAEHLLEEIGWLWLV